MAPIPWAQVGQPILLDRPRRRARLTPYETGRPAKGHGLRPGRWGQTNPNPPRPGPEELCCGGEAQLVATAASPATEESPLAAPSPSPSPSPNAPGLPGCGRAAGRAVPARNRRDHPAPGGLGGVARPGPPTASAQFPAGEPRLLPGPRAAGGSPPGARACPSSLPLSPLPASPYKLGPSRGRDGVKISGPRLLRILHQFRTAGVGPTGWGASEVLRALASPRGRRRFACSLPPAWRWFRSCPNLAPLSWY